MVYKQSIRFCEYIYGVKEFDDVWCRIKARFAGQCVLKIYPL